LAPVACVGVPNCQSSLPPVPSSSSGTSTPTGSALRCTMLAPPRGSRRGAGSVRHFRGAGACARV
jgi:hypothetical protein